MPAAPIRASMPGRLFDFHVHFLGVPDLDDAFLAFALAHGMRFGVSCLGAHGAMIARPTAAECRDANDRVLALIDAHPDLATGFCYVNPLLEADALREIDRCVRGGPMRGIKLWIAAVCDGPGASVIAERAAELGVPVLQHAWVRLGEPLPGESGPRDVAALARRHPRTRFVMAHMAFDWETGIDAVADCPNVSVDTSGFDTEAGSVEFAVERLGAGRVLFGSDAPGRDVLCQIAKVLAAEIPEDARDLILRGSAERLLDGAAR